MNHKRRWPAATAALAIAGTGLASAAQRRPARRPRRSRGGLPRLLGDLARAGTGRTRRRLQQLIDEHGTLRRPTGTEEAPGRSPSSTGTTPSSRTTSRDATIAWVAQARQDPAARELEATPASGSPRPPTARSTEACGTAVPVGKPLPTSTDTDCADEIFEVRAEAQDDERRGRLRGGVGPPPHRAAVRLGAAALRRAHVRRDLSVRRRRPATANLAAPIGSEQEGRHAQSHRLRALLRPAARPDPHLQKAGLRRLHRLGGSPSPSPRSGRTGVGIDAEHTHRHPQRPAARAASPRPPRAAATSRTSEDETIPYIDGKRCWINKEIFGIKGRAA